MGSKIDSQMQQIYSDCVQKGGSSGQKVAEPEAMKLITRAETLNNSYTSSCFSSSNRGNKYLKKLVKDNPANFTPEGNDTNQSYLSTGRIPTPMRVPNMSGPGLSAKTSGASGVHPGVTHVTSHVSPNVVAGRTPHANAVSPTA